MFGKNSLLFKTLRLIVVSITLLTIVISIYSYITERSVALESLETEAEFINKITAETIGTYTWNINKEKLQELMDILLANKNLSAIVVRNEDNTVFLAGVKQKGKIEYFSELFEKKEIRDYYFISSHQLVNGTKNYGMIKYYYTDDAIQKELFYSIFEKIFKIIVVIIITMIIILIGVNKRVLKPLFELNNTVKLFGDRNFSVRSSNNTNDEIGELSKNFNLMADTIQAHNEDLEQTVNERTKQLLHAEKMASLGELVAGVSHEINTPVGIGVTAITHLQKRTRDFFAKYETNSLTKSDLEIYTNEVREAISLISTNLNRAADLVQSFKKVAVDRSSEDKRQFKVKEYFDDVILSLRPKYKKTNHTIKVDCKDDLIINSYPGSFSQIITNLVINSLIHGFEGIDSGEMVLAARTVDNNFIFEYSDNGKGVPEENLEKIFNPFFTTKRNKGGSGLGMHIVFNIVKQNLNGNITLESAPGEGIKVIITVPLDS